MGNSERDALAATLYSFDKQLDSLPFEELNDFDRAPYFEKADGIMASAHLSALDTNQSLGADRR